MAKHVKGTLFLDYVRMIRKRKNVDWSKYLTPQDQKVLSQMVLPSEWYPLETFQHCGVAILHEIAQGDVEAVRAWGRASMDELMKVYKNLAQETDPHKATEKFQLLRRRFFDFEGLEVIPQAGNRIQVKVDMAFGGVADEAYAYQILGTLERLLLVSGAKNVQFQFLQKAWKGAPNTVIELSWG
ncbi:MAG: hypothetical protein A2V67_05105 [Deltaproteobacteria bacterium RBG_13_61_14]|nr:MAG: hypothetical protein A2V67_05105 [Deltaproteobacteria bacterium RBG_13_61_14]